MRTDLVYAFRLLTGRPVLTVIIVLSLATGLGANTTVFSLVRAILLKALPYPDPNRIVDLRIGIASATPGAMFGWQLQRWREASQVMLMMAGYDVTPMPLTGGDSPAELVTVAQVTSDFFRVLGRRPAQGTTFNSEDTRPGTHVAILSHELWQRRYKADGRMVGGTVTLDGVPYAVVGIMPPGFSFPENAACWIALTMTPDGMRAERAPGGAIGLQPARMKAIGRLRADANLDRVAEEGVKLLSRAAVPVTVRVSTLQEALVGPVRSLLMLLQAAVLVLLAMVCANVVSMLLARGASRRHEFAVRTSLGAGRWRLLRQALTESAVLVCVGALVGLALAHWLTAVVKRLAPPEVPLLADVQVDTGVLAFTAILSAITVVACGVLPVWGTLRDVTDIRGLRLSGTGPGARGGSDSVLRIIVVGQVAASLILLTGALVLLNAVWRLARIDPGFTARQIVTGRLTIPGSTYTTAEQLLVLVREVLDQLRAMPGVDAVAVSNAPPFAADDRRIRFSPKPRERAHEHEEASARWRIVDGDFFGALSLRIVQGRALDATDVRSAQPVVVINNTLAKSFFGAEQVIGSELTLENNLRRQVVGVVADIKERSLWEQATPTIYEALPQFITSDPRSPLPRLWMARPYVLIKSHLPIASLATSLREVVDRIDRRVVVDDVRTLDERLADSTATITFAASLFSLLGLLALLTAVGGLYGSLAYWVVRRSPELGVRLALGASPRRLQRLVLQDALGMMGTGIAVGLLGSWYAARLVQGLASNTRAPQPISVTSAAAILTVAGLIAAWQPARRAARVDPLQALRTE